MSSENKYKWTVMVYLAGDNNLTDECIYALTEMRKVGSDARVKIIAQFDPQDQYLPTQRYEISMGDTPGTLIDDRFDDTSGGSFKIKSTKDMTVPTMRPGAGVSPDETATGDPATLFNFISMCIEQAPADHYMLVIAGHGSGTEKDYLLKDDSPEGYLTIPELKWALGAVQNNYSDADGNPLVIDILGMDVCLMSMVEICYELRDLVRVSVGCESYSPASGWPYRPVLARLAEIANPTTSAGSTAASQEPAQNNLAKAIVEEYINFYADYWLGGLSVDQAAIDVSKIGELKDLISQLADNITRKLTQEDEREQNKQSGEIRTYPFKDALILAHWDAQSYNGELYVDVADFCTCLSRRCNDGDVSALCDRLAAFIKSSLVLKSCYSGPTYQYSYGVSIYFPWAEVAPDYQNLDFAQPSGWLQFLELYTDLTRRAPREAERDVRFFDMNLAPPQRFRQSSGKGPENPMHSMRNPPIVALPSECMREKAKNVEGSEEFFLN